MTTRTITIEHPGTHQPSDEQISAALRKVLADDGLRRVDGAKHTVKGGRVKSNGPSTLTVEVDTEEREVQGESGPETVALPEGGTPVKRTAKKA